MKTSQLLRAKTIDLRVTRPLTRERQENSMQNQEEALAGAAVLKAKPRRLVFELTNACNLNCVMCGRNAADFKPTQFQMEWLHYFEDAAQRIEEVTLMGWGEPTVHPHFADFLKWAHRLGLRKYFCTNGMRLDRLFEDIFETETDIIGVSMDGASAEMNSRIRRGSDFQKIVQSIERISKYKYENGLEYPYLNFVFTAMEQNLPELPELVRLAGEIGMDEVKVVYLTAFDDEMECQTLYDKMAYVEEVFEAALEAGQSCGVSLKLPHLVGEDPAGDALHKPCYTAWRGFFLGSDGYIRPCMSTAEKLFPIQQYADFDQMWNAPEYQQHRCRVNGCGMEVSCRNCYQSSYANWNKRDSFLQIGKHFSPEWQKETEE